MRNGAVSSKSLLPRRSRMKEFCGDDVEVCQPSWMGWSFSGRHPTPPGLEILKKLYRPKGP
jgi:hypothetical protein